MNVFRNLLYSLMMFVFVTLEFCLLIKLTFWLFDQIETYQPAISDSLFWTLFVLAGFMAIFIANFPLVFISVTLIRKIAITPDWKYAIWFARIYSIMFCAFAITQTFSATSSGKMLFVFVIMAIIMMRAVYVNVVATSESVFVRKIVSETEGLTEKQFRAEMKAVMKPQKNKNDEIITNIKKRMDELNRAADKDDGF